MPFRVRSENATLSHSRCDLKSHRNDRFELVNIGNIVDKAQRLAAVKEADGRRIPGGENCGLGKPVQAGSGG